MAIPSSKYAEDESARETLANGTVLKWTKKNSQIYTTPNVDTDRSICYCNWKGELDYANRGFHQWQGGCATGDDLGHNGNEGAGFENLHANSLKQNEFGQPRMEGLYTGVVLTNSNSDGAYVWGYNPEKSECINNANGAERRYLLDMDVNKMIFNITVNVYDQADFDAIDYLNSNNPESYQLPNVHNITLKQLYDNPDDYYVESFSWGTTYVYGENTSDHWRSAQIFPAHIINGENVGQFKGTKNFSIFGMHYATGNFSYDNSNPMNPNAHPNFGGGGSTPVIYNNMNVGYFMACGKDINLNPVYSYSAAGTSAESIAQYKWGTTSSWNHNAYVNQEFFDYGGSVIWCAYGAHAYYNVNTSESKYKEYFFFTRKMLKGQYALDYIASFGLYFASESFDPDSVNLTPETLGDDNRIMLGEMSADGTTTGRWITDIDSYHGPNKDGKTNNPTYDPSGGGGGGSSGDDYTDMSLGVANLTLGGLTKYAILSKQNLIDLVIDYNTNKATAGTNFSNHVICLYRLGFGASDLVVTNSEKIKMIQSAGQVDFESSANYSVVTRQTPFIHFGSITVPRHTGTFYDFAPYSSYELYIPGCGWIPLPDNVAGRTLNVYLVFDLPTCSAKGIVRIAGDVYGGTTIATVNGIIGASVPFTIGENGMQRAAILSGSTQTAAALGTAFLGVGTGNLYMGASGVAMAANGIASNYVAGNTNFISTKGGASDFSAFGDGAGAILKCNCPEIDPVVNESMFGHTVGYLCNEVGKLSTFSGFTVCDNPHVTFSATSREREEIELLLSRGVIL